jgi:hypothetical protein
MTSTPFELLELPDGRWCVARIACAASTLIAGSFAPLEPHAHVAAPTLDPVGIFPSRDAAELAIQRGSPKSPSPLSSFTTWLNGAADSER